MLEKKCKRIVGFSGSGFTWGAGRTWPLFALLVCSTFVITQIPPTHQTPPVASFQQPVVSTEHKLLQVHTGASPAMAKPWLWSCCVNQGSWMAPQGSQLQTCPASLSRYTNPRGKQSQLLHTEDVSIHELLPGLGFIYCEITAWMRNILGLYLGLYLPWHTPVIFTFLSLSDSGWEYQKLSLICLKSSFSASPVKDRQIYFHAGCDYVLPFPLLDALTNSLISACLWLCPHCNWIHTELLWAALAIQWAGVTLTGQRI